VIRSSRPFLALLPMVALGAWLLWFAPSKWWGIDTGMAGSVTLSACAWVGAFLVSRGHDLPGHQVGNGEQQAWLGLLFLAAIYAYVLTRMSVLGNAPDLYSDPNARAVGRNIAIMAIVWIVIAARLRHLRQDEVLEDERDRRIANVAESFGNGALVFCLIAVIVTVGFSPADRLSWLTPVRTAAMLLNVLILRSLLAAVAQVFLYWRDRQ